MPAVAARLATDVSCTQMSPDVRGGGREGGVGHGCMCKLCDQVVKAIDYHLKHHRCKSTSYQWRKTISNYHPIVH